MSANSRVVWISASDPPDAFPGIDTAMREPDGLLAAGGDLSSLRLLAAYRLGIFPWFDDGQPILWWSPDPRCVMFPRDFYVSRRLKRDLRQSTEIIRFNVGFGQVIRECAAPRFAEQGTWITTDMMSAYGQLHEEGWAHSVEVWQDDVLVGGLYGLAIGKVFFGESMFSRRDNASKYALYALSSHLQDHGFHLIDCQVASQHLLTLGATMLPREKFSQILQTGCEPSTKFANWPDSPLPVADISSV